MAAGEGTLEASMVKAYVCRAAEWVTREAMQLHGGMGYAEEFPVSRFFVDARVLSIFEGADETLCLRVIARRLAENALASVLGRVRRRSVVDQRRAGCERDETVTCAPRREVGDERAPALRRPDVVACTPRPRRRTGLRCGERPRPRLLDVAVRLGDQLHDRLRRALEIEHPSAAATSADVDVHAASSGHESSAGIAPRTPSRAASATTRCTRFPIPCARSRLTAATSRASEKSVSPTRGTSPREPPPQRVGAVAIDQRARVDRVAERLADLAPAGGDVVVHEDLVGQGDARRQEDRGPDHGVESQDPLADDVAPRAAPRPSIESGRADVVRERVEPHVDDCSGSPGTGMPQSPTRARGRETLRSRTSPARKPSTSFRRSGGSMRNRPSGSAPGSRARTATAGRTSSPRRRARAARRARDTAARGTPRTRRSTTLRTPTGRGHPGRSARRHSSSTTGRWRGSALVRMKSSYEIPSASVNDTKPGRVRRRRTRRPGDRPTPRPRARSWPRARRCR